MVNDKGQVFWVDTSTTPLSIGYYLPTDDYDKEAGIHRIDLPADTDAGSVSLIGVTDSGEVYGALKKNDDRWKWHYYATRNQTYLDLGGLKPLHMSDDGVVYGDRLSENTDAEPYRSPFLVAYDTLTLTDQKTLDATPVIEKAGIYRSYIRDIKANENGLFTTVRADWAAYNGVIFNGETVVNDVPHFRTHTVNQLSFTQPASRVPGTPDGTGEMPDVLVPDNYHLKPSYETAITKSIKAVNGKGEFLWETTLCLDEFCNDFEGERIRTAVLYLPEAAYGLPAGNTYLNNTIHFTGNLHGLTKITDNGDIFVANQTFIWTNGQFITPHAHLVGGENAVITQAMDINNNGDYLGVGTINGGDPKLLLLSNAAAIRATVTVEPRNAELNEAVFLNVEITNKSKQPFTTTGVYGESFSISGTALEGLVQLQNPPPADSLAPQKTFTQRFSYKPTKAGKLKFSLQGAGYFADGTLNLTDPIVSDEVQVGKDPIEITFEALPLVSSNPPDGQTMEPIVNMQVEEDPENPGTFIVRDDPPGDGQGNVINPKVKVTFTNNWEKEADFNVTIQGLDERARDKTALAGRVKLLGTFPMELGTIAHGQSVEKEFDLDIRDDGRFEFKATVTAVEAGSTEEYRIVSSGAPIAVGVPYPVELELDFVQTTAISDQKKGVFIVQPGGSIQLVASVNNLTSNSTLEFYGIRAKKKLNALAAHLTSEEGRSYNPKLPFVHDHTVDANASVVLGGTIFTSADGGSSGTVTWQGLEDAKLIDDQTKAETKLTADDILIRKTIGGWLHDDLKVKIIQDNSRPETTSLTGFQEVAIYSRSAMVGMGEWTHDTFDAIGGIGRVAGYISGNPSILADTWGEGSRAVWEFAQLIGETWSEMTTEEKEEFILSVVSEAQRRLALLKSTRSPVDSEDSNAVLEFTRTATYSLFNGIEQAYASDDPEKIANELGRVSGHVVMEIITAAVSELKFNKYIKGAEVTKRAKNKSLGAPLTDQEAELRRIVSGPLTDAKVFEVFGPGEEDLRLFEKVFKVFGVKGYARDRNPLSYDLINIRKVAVWKPEEMKPKGISKIDLILLGDNLPKLPGADGKPIDLEAITGIFWPGSHDEVKARLDKLTLTKQVRDACIERAAKRREEFDKYYPKFGKWADGDGIPVSPNLVDNGIPNPEGTENLTRDFAVDVILRGEDGPTLFIPKMANQAGELRYISGDIDWVHFSFLDGTPLDPDTAFHLYTTLMRCCGMQHPETVTWINNGQSIFKGKVNQLAEYVRGENALLEVSGEGARAVRISENFTRFIDGENARNHLIFFNNGIKSRYRATLADIETGLAQFKPAYKVSLPSLWSARMNDPLQSENTIDGKDWSYNAVVDGAVMLRQNDDSVLEMFNGVNWLPFSSPGETPQSEGIAWAQQLNDEKLFLSPLTQTEYDAIAGDTVLHIFDLPALWPTQLEGRVDQWFQVGDSIVIAPGELTQEIRTVLSLDPLRLDEHLYHDHPEGTTVAVIPPNMSVADVSDTASVMVGSAEENGNTSLIWSTLPNHRYHFEIETAPGEWTVVQENLDADFSAIAVTMPSSEYDSGSNYRLRKIGPIPQPLAITSFVADPIAKLLELTWTQQPTDSYLIEISETMQPGSWSTLLPQPSPVGAHVMASLPMSSLESPSRFYRIRSSDETQLAAEETIVAIDYDETTGTVMVTWATKPRAEYQLESATYEAADMWESAGEPVTAESDRAVLVLPGGTSTDGKLFRVTTIKEAPPPYHTWLRNQLETEYGLTGGAWVTGSTESEAMSKVFTPESVTRSDFLVEDQPFVSGLNLKNAVAPSNSWEDFVHVKAHEPIQSGDVLLMVAWVRGVDLGGGQPSILHAFELADPPYTGVAYHQVATSGEWTQYLIPMEATFDLPTSWYKIHLGYAVQEIEVGGVAILNFGSKYTVDQLPKLNVP